MASSEEYNQVHLNVLTKDQFDTATVNDGELYAVTDVEFATKEYVNARTTSVDNAFSFLAADTSFTNNKTIASVTTPETGTYLAIGVITAPGTTAYNYLGAQIYAGSTQKANATQDMGSNANRAQVTVMSVFAANKGDNITLRVVLGAATTISKQSGLVLLRLS